MYRVIPHNKDDVATSKEQAVANKSRRRLIFGGWDNITPFEVKFLEDLKVQLFERYKIDFSDVKSFGPRLETGTHILTNMRDKRRDILLTERHMLRFAAARYFDMEITVKEVAEHIAWRQQNIPVPILNKKALACMNKGVLYIHGRTKDFSPILVLDITNLAGLLKSGEMDPESFCVMHNFIAGYVQANMLTPGQVEKQICLVNLNQYPCSELPLSMFKAAANELNGNFSDTVRKVFIVNATWF